MTAATPDKHARTPGWTAPVALLIAVLATALAVWALVRPAGESVTSVATDSPTAAAGADKAGVCAAFTSVRNAVSLQTNANLGPDPVARTAVAANARLATLGGGSYLLTQLGTATPADLADAVRGFANDLQDIGVKQLAGIANTDPTLNAQLGEAQNTANHIAELCK